MLVHSHIARFTLCPSPDVAFWVGESILVNTYAGNLPSATKETGYLGHATMVLLKPAMLAHVGVESWAGLNMCGRGACALQHRR